MGYVKAPKKVNHTLDLESESSRPGVKSIALYGAAFDT